MCEPITKSALHPLELEMNRRGFRSSERGEAALGGDVTTEVAVAMERRGAHGNV